MKQSRSSVAAVLWYHAYLKALKVTRLRLYLEVSGCGASFLILASMKIMRVGAPCVH
jgi:hypothetical protein